MSKHLRAPTLLMLLLPLVQAPPSTPLPTTQPAPTEFYVHAHCKWSQHWRENNLPQWSEDPRVNGLKAFIVLGAKGYMGEDPWSVLREVIWWRELGYTAHPGFSHVWGRDGHVYEDWFDVRVWQYLADVTGLWVSQGFTDVAFDLEPYGHTTGRKYPYWHDLTRLQKAMAPLVAVIKTHDLRVWLLPGGANYPQNYVLGFARNAVHLDEATFDDRFELAPGHANYAQQWANEYVLGLRDKWLRGDWGRQLNEVHGVTRTWYILDRDDVWDLFLDSWKNKGESDGEDNSATSRGVEVVALAAA